MTIELTEEQRALYKSFQRFTRASTHVTAEACKLSGMESSYADNVPIVAMIRLSAELAIASAIAHGREPNRELWDAACNAAFEQALKASRLIWKAISEEEWSQIDA